MSLISTQANFGGRQPTYTSYVKQFVSSPGSTVPWVFVKDGTDTYIEPSIVRYPILIPQDTIMNGDLTVYGTFSNPSDEKLKTQINWIDKTKSDKLLSIIPRQYKFKSQSLLPHLMPVLPPTTPVWSGVAFGESERPEAIGRRLGREKCVMADLSDDDYPSGVGVEIETETEVEAETVPPCGSEGGDNRLHFGFIAQEVEKVYPEMVSSICGNIKTVNYLEFIPLMVDHIKTLHDEINSLKERIDVLERK